jgi:predicted site-specific integrase-resolvase
MVQDVLSILTVFSCRVNGLRKYKNKIEDDFKVKEKEETGQEEEQS